MSATFSSTTVRVSLLLSTDLVYIPISLIETMQCIDHVDDEVAVVNALSDDLWVKVTLLSGREHVVSIKMIKQKVKSEKTVEEVWVDIVEQWADVFTNKKGK